MSSNKTLQLHEQLPFQRLPEIRHFRSRVVSQRNGAFDRDPCWDVGQHKIQAS
jgi:hypothetical protein